MSLDQPAQSGFSPLIAVVGPTATGKTALGVALAMALDGEVVGADSRQVYRGMAIGTAQPSDAELALVPHYLVGTVAPDEEFGLAIYLEQARTAIDAIRAKGKAPVLVGGTGQYVWALLEGWTVPRVPPDIGFRRQLEEFAATEGTAALHARLQNADPAAATTIHPRNVRRVIRALEVFHHTGRPISQLQRREMRTTVPIVGLNLPRTELYERIDRRVQTMYAGGLMDEIARLDAAGFGSNLPSMASIGYPDAWAACRGEIPVEEAIRRTQLATHRLARQQQTWFRADDSRIHWSNGSSTDSPTGVAALVQQLTSALAAN
jgi:tRNA dimethylallyltransferase